MEESGIRITSRDWLDDYEHRYQKARLIWKEKILEEAKHVNNPFDAYASNPFIMPEGRPVSEMDIQEAEIVVYVISRISGEGKDRRLEKGDYYLSEREEKDILFLNSRSVPIVLLINAGGPVELTDILEKAQWIKRYPQYFPAWTGGGTCGCKDPSWRSCSKRKAYNNLGKKI